MTLKKKTRGCRAKQALRRSRTSWKLPPVVGATFVAVGDEHACAVARTSAETTTSLYCWGGNTNGELGDGTKVLRRTPVHVTQMPRS